MVKKCYYCRVLILDNNNFSFIKEAIKPPNASNRWKCTGYCCEFCLNELNCPIIFDRYKSLVNLNRSNIFDIYIGYGSEWQNDFKITKRISRTKCIIKYQKDLWEKMNKGEIPLTKLANLYNKKLGCFCMPLPCHGDILMKASALALYVLTSQKNKQ